jgi:peptidyl-Lys metalloendopeptidase
MWKGRIQFAFVFVVLAALLITTVALAAPKSGPTVSLSVSQGKFDSSQDVWVTVTLSNDTKNTVHMLKWFTPVDGVEESLFVVKRDGQAVAYIGPRFKRAAVTEEDYISLKSGESVSSAVNLGEYYDLSQSGQYEVAYGVASFNLFNEKGNAFQVKDVLASEKVSMDIVGRLAKVTPTPPPPGGGGGKSTPTPPPPGGGGGNTFNACSTTRQSQLVSARNESKIYASNAENYLLANNQGSRYTTWFGVFSSTRYNTIKSHFTAISNAMDTAGVQFDCTCTQTNVYAYVYPNQPYKIFLCGAFWAAPLTGTDSKAGTLIHEMSHFDVVANTDDYAYGQTAARNLAASNPDQAIRNADNHEYFAENTPPLP